MAEDVELCLEIQVDPESKKILSNLHKCRSTLLDITVIKPKEIETSKTQRTSTLRADEVRRLITSLEKQRRRKHKILNNLINDDTIVKVCKHKSRNSTHNSNNFKRLTTHVDLLSSTSPIDDLERKDFIGITESIEPLFCEIRRSLKNVETTITNMQDIKIVVSQTTANKTLSGNYFGSSKKKHVIPSTRFRNQSIYRVETTPDDLTPALLCQHNQTLDHGDEIKGKCLCENCGTVGHLIECQKHPLLSELSQSSPPTKIFHKTNDHKNKKTRFNLDNTNNYETSNSEETTYTKELNNRIKLLEDKLLVQEERLVSKDYFKKIISKIVNNFAPKLLKSKSDESIYPYFKPKDNTVLNKLIDTKSNESIRKSDKSTFTDDELCYGTYIWKWGEEILKPGIDLKNRITNLLHEFFGKLTISDKSDVKNIIQYMDIKTSNAHLKAKNNGLNKTDNDSSYATLSKAFIDKSHLKKASEHVRDEKNVNISFINPKLSLWEKESPSLSNLPQQSTIPGRQEFIRIVAKAKQCQKEVLWKNIWSQAKANGQSKNDNITIKIPIQNKKNKTDNMLETELTIREVENILRN